ncbi:hypothetical protein EJ02DRAFT_201248 [Clathrospora elynae]|uniref:Uncharacterized protein n=1 Tax=Clathrospora elynae TaxID=706981 RepID=A0A6A5SWZ5_9PLEO|nr:hypothetical protein EJ02DRAFT_201248 [Clathrospora elynae]
MAASGLSAWNINACNVGLILFFLLSPISLQSSSSRAYLQSTTLSQLASLLLYEPLSDPWTSSNSSIAVFTHHNSLQSRDIRITTGS